MTTAVACALYNGGRYLHSQLESLLRQTRQPEKVVFFDDDSFDDTLVVLREFIDKHSLHENWLIFENEENVGYVQNFYRAIAHCDADLVFLCDQDDVWADDKIEKMAEVMEKRGEVLLLSCGYGMIDADDREIRSGISSKRSDSFAVTPVTVTDIARASRWPGMTMCLRKTFFDEIRERIADSRAIHDQALGLLAADQNGFFAFDYTGAFHRRHANNAAREEHRLFKQFSSKKKLRDLNDAIFYWTAFSSPDFGLGEKSLAIAKKRLGLMLDRREALEERSLSKIFSLYFKKGKGLLRLPSFLCDVVIVLFHT